MVNKNKCYYCGTPINETNKSEEHIIQNGIGGHLTSKFILCNEHNQTLNNEIDRPFLKTFENFFNRMDFNRDRNTNIRGIKAKLQELNIDVIIKNGKTFPLMPFFDTETNTLFAQNKKVGDIYLNKLLKERTIANKEDVIFKDDIEGTIQMDFNLDNIVFKKGLTKIAVNFASVHKLTREEMPDALDLKNNTFLDALLVIPYLPENFDLLLQDSEKYYPIHMLLLRAEPKEKLLYCYIELFSTFQYYIILNKHYIGPTIREEYVYSLSENKGLSLNEYLWSFKNYEEMMKNSFKLPNFQFLITEFENNKSIFQMNGHAKFNKLNKFVNLQNIFKKLKLNTQK